jgi:hypothetical protein
MAKSVKKVAKAPVAKAKPVTTGKVITLLTKENPKRGASKGRFGFYKTGMSTEAYISKVVAAGRDARLARADLSWDLAHQFISIK